MNVLGVIPARGGSKRLIGKNIRPLAGVPLIGWSLRAARESRELTRAIVTTDDAEIAETARSLGGEVPFLRPKELAADDTTTLAVLRHALGWVEQADGKEPDLVVLLQPTSPLRLAREIDACVRLVLDTGADSAQTVLLDETHPTHRFKLDGDRLAPMFPGMQAGASHEAPKIYRPSGSVYVMRSAVLRSGRIAGADHRGLVCPPETSVDIDNELDLHIAEWILSRRERAAA